MSVMTVATLDIATPILAQLPQLFFINQNQVTVGINMNLHCFNMRPDAYGRPKQRFQKVVSAPNGLGQRSLAHNALVKIPLLFRQIVCSINQVPRQYDWYLLLRRSWCRKRYFLWSNFVTILAGAVFAAPAK
jgi:hypothetical protein